MACSSKKMRRSSLFIRTDSDDDEDLTINMPYKSSVDTMTNDSLRGYIQDLENERKAWKDEIKQVKIDYAKMKKQKSKIVKASDKELLTVLPEESRNRYISLFEDQGFSKLLQDISDLKINVAMQVEYNKRVVNAYYTVLSEENTAVQADFENIMNEMADIDDEGFKDLSEDESGEEMDDVLHLSDEESEYII